MVTERELTERWREVRKRMIKAFAEGEKSEGGRKVVYWFVEVCSKSDTYQVAGKVRNGLVERRAEGEVGEGGR